MSTQEKQRLIRLIHVARRDLQLDEETYRAVLREKTGKLSAKDLAQHELENVLSHMKSKGFKVRKPASKNPTESRPLDQEETSRKVRALWLLLHELGAVKNPAESALAAYVKRIAHVDDLRWTSTDQAVGLIETLKKWCVRVWPDQIARRWQRLHEAGKIEAMTEAAVKIRRVRNVGPAVGADTFDGLHAVWLSLDHAEGVTKP